MELVGVPLVEAINMASINPARRIGKDADIVIFEKDFSVCKTFIRGKKFIQYRYSGRMI